RRSSRKSTTSALAMEIPASRSTRNRAGSAPTRAGAMASRKSPHNVARTAVPAPSGMPQDRAARAIFKPRNTNSMATAPRSRRCVRHGRPSFAPPSGQCATMTYPATAMAASNETIAMNQRIRDIAFSSYSATSLPLQCRHPRDAREGHALALDHPPEDAVEQLLVGHVLDIERESLRLLRVASRLRIALVERHGRRECHERTKVRLRRPDVPQRPPEVIELGERREPENL